MCVISGDFIPLCVARNAEYVETKPALLQLCVCQKMLNCQLTKELQPGCLMKQNTLRLNPPSLSWFFLPGVCLCFSFTRSPQP